MFSAALIVPLLLATQVMASPERQQFSRCLRSFVDSKIEDRTEPAAFDTALAGACTQQEAAYRTAYIAAAIRAGDSRTMAERDAGIEIEDLRTNFKEIFRSAQPE